MGLASDDSPGLRRLGGFKLSILCGGAFLAVLFFTTVAGASTAPGGEWSPALNLSTPTGANVWADVASNERGDFVVAWSWGDFLYARRYSAEGGWEDQTFLGPGVGLIPARTGGGWIRDLDVAMDAGGNATVVWIDVVYLSVSRQQPGGNWSTPAHINDTWAWALDTTVVPTPSGGLVVAWAYAYDGNCSIRALEYEPSLGWTVTHLIDNGSADYASVSGLTVTTDGTAIILWTTSGLGFYQAFSATRPAGGNWSAPLQIQAEYAFVSGGAVVSLESGRALATWLPLDVANETVNFTASFFDPVTGWGPPFALSAVTPAAEFLAAAGSSTGTAAMGWIGPNATGNYSEPSIWATLYRPTVGWSAPRIVAAGSIVSASLPGFEVGVGRDGDALLVFGRNNNGSSEVWAVRYATAVGWTPAERIDSGNATAAFGGAVAVDAGGDGLTVWMEEGVGGYSAWARVSGVAPSLIVTAPVDGTVTEFATVRVRGVTDPGVSLSVGGLLATVAADGTFSVVVALEAGLNEIVVQAVDEWGHRAVVIVTVVYADPTEALRERIAALEARTAELEAELAAAEALLAGFEARQGATEADLNATRAQVAVAEAALAEAIAALDDLAARIDELQLLIDQALEFQNASGASSVALEAELNRTREALAATIAQLDTAMAQLDRTQQALDAALARLAASEAQLDDQSANAGSMSSQIATLSLLGTVAFIAAIAGIGLTLVLARRSERKKPE